MEGNALSPTRRRYSAHEKAAILREHLLEGVPISKICKKYGMPH